MTEVLRRCRKGRTHEDALALVWYLMEKGGKVSKTNEAIAMDLGMLKNLGGGNLRVDDSRFQQARHHVQDRTEDEKPCCGYRLHYRASGRRGSELTLIDPTGDLGAHADAAIESVRGWMSRESQHHTENQRQIETWQTLGDHALSRGDKVGYRLCTTAAVDLDQHGTVTSKTMAEVTVWINGMQAAAP